MAITNSHNENIDPRYTQYYNWYNHEMDITLISQGTASSTVRVVATITNIYSSAGWSQFYTPKITIYYLNNNDINDKRPLASVVVDQVYPKGIGGSFSRTWDVTVPNDNNRIPFTLYYEFKHNITSTDYKFVSDDCSFSLGFNYSEFNLNILNPSGVEDTNVASVNFSFNDGVNWERVSNEPISYVPIGQTLQMKEIEPSAGYQLQSVTGMSLEGDVYKAVKDTHYLTVEVHTDYQSYTITYDANGGSDAPSATTYTYAPSGTITLSSTVPTRSGYAFKGWSTSDSATTATYLAGGEFPKNITSDTILYAVWWPYLDVNGTLDDTAMGGVSGLGTFDITIGSSTLTNQEDYYQALQPDTSYSISNITQEYGYTYTGNTGSLSGTISNPTDIMLNYITKKPWDVNIRTNERTTSSIALSWGAEGLNITKYVLHYRADSVSSFTHRDMGTSTTATLFLLEDTNYEIYVTATNSAGSTDSSHYNDSTLLTNPRIDNFVTTNITPFTVSTLTTVLQSRTRDLEYQFSTDGGTTWSAAQASNSYTFIGLNEETTYTLGVKVTRKHIGVSSSDTYATTTLQVTTPADQAQIWRHNGSVWQKGKAFVFDNNTWKKAKKIYRYDGSNWVVNKNN